MMQANTPLTGLGLETLFEQLRANRIIDLQLSHNQQRIIVNTFSYLDVFNVSGQVLLTDRQAVCHAILNPDEAEPQDATVLDVLSELRLYLQRLYDVGPVRNFFPGDELDRTQTTLSEMYQFVYFLLAAVEQNSGATVEYAHIPAAPDGAYKRYDQQPIPDQTLTIPRPIEEQSALQPLERAIAGMNGMPRQAIAYLRVTVNIWLNSNKGTDALLRFRRDSEVFFQDEAVRSSYVTHSFFGESESAELQQIRTALYDLRGLSQLHQKANENILYDRDPAQDILLIATSAIQAIVHCIDAMSFFPLFVIIGFVLPILKSLFIGLFLAVNLCEMPWEATGEYFEAFSNVLFLQIPLFLLGVAALSALSGLCIVLLVSGVEILPMMAASALFTLVVSSLCLAVPSLFALLGRGLYEGGQALSGLMFGAVDDAYYDEAPAPYFAV